MELLVPYSRRHLKKQGHSPMMVPDHVRNKPRQGPCASYRVFAIPEECESKWS